MPVRDRVQIGLHVDATGALATMAGEIRAGLTADPKHLPSKYFYDERGSELFERITLLPEYYLTRAEQRLLDEHADRIAALVRPVSLVELGSGSAKKTRLLIDAARSTGALRRYLPVEVSLEMAEQTANSVADEYGDLEVHAIVGDFERHLDRVPHGECSLVAFLGSTIGNFPSESAVGMLKALVPLVEERGALLLGTDLVKSVERLERAYNDSLGVTAQFNLNILEVVNHRLRGNFVVGEFEHVSYFNSSLSRIESYVRSRCAQSVRIEALELEVSFGAGEMMRTEVSCKYTRDSLTELLDRAGLELTHWFAGADDEFALSLSRVSS